MSKKVVTKALVVNHLNENIGLSKRECQIFLESFLDVIFFDPKTKEEFMISERNVVKFKPSDFLINLINSNIVDKDEIK